MFLQDAFVHGDRIGDLPHQSAELADLGDERIDRAARPVHGRAHIAFHGVEPARDLGHLAGEVGGAARQIGDLATEVAAVAQPVADGVVERHGGERGHARDRRGGAIEFEAEKQHGAERRGDEHHADRDEYGADTTHAADPERRQFPH